MRNCFILLLLCGFLFSSCQTTAPIKLIEPKIDRVRFSLIYIIHGDGSYLYHDANGNPFYADKEALRQAISVAEHNTESEVSIFHLKRRKGLLGYLSQKDGDFYYYLGGRLFYKLAYSRKRNRLPFEIESSLFRKYTSEVTHSHNFLLYFGHQIPEFDGRKYHASYPCRKLTIENFSNGLKEFKVQREGEEHKFDLIVVSTCYSGTPGVIKSLLPHARFIIASPDNLHLSYIHSALFQSLDESEYFDEYRFMKRVAGDAFEELCRNTQTMITISLYDTEKVAPFLIDIEEYYCQIIEMLGSSRSIQPEPFDCGEDPFFSGKGIGEGVDVFYRPPKFGKEKNKLTHSGWNCWRLVQKGQEKS